MIGYHEARQRLLEHAAPRPLERLPLAQAEGRILAVDLTAPAALPPFANSAMDGYALAVPAGGLAAGSLLPVVGLQAAGAGLLQHAEGAVEIMTGARLPEGRNAVIAVERSERVDAGGSSIRLLDALEPGLNVRLAGEDVGLGEPLLAAGRRIDAASLSLCAALGIGALDLRRRPRVGLIATGRELVDDPEQPLAIDQIRNSNTPFLRTRLLAAGAELVHSETVGDEVEGFLAALERAGLAGAEVLISTGAVSMGRYDFVPGALARLGAETLFHKTAIRPGKPILAARLADGRMFFGLPGNPVSAAVGLRFFVEPLLRQMLGLAEERPWRLPLAEALARKPALRMFLKGRLGWSPEGRLQACILAGQESFRIRPLLQTSVWLALAEAAGAVAAGAEVEVFGLGHLQPPLLPEQ